MAKGTITEVVDINGMGWGKIRKNEDGSNVLFNRASLCRPGDFSALREGVLVSFEETRDEVYGIHATSLTIAEPVPMSDFSRPFGR